jgi:hypothetical protein
MAEQPVTERPVTNAQPMPHSEVARTLALWVVVGSISFIAVASALGLLLSLWVDSVAVFVANWKELMGMLLPVLGTWVGTVLAFYFSKENFESANQNVRAMVRQISARDQLRAISAKEVMIPVGSIIGLKLGDSQTDRDIDLVNDVLRLISDKVTRVPIQAANGAIKYVVHESTLHKYLYNAAAGSPPGPAGLTLEDLVNDALGKLIKAIAFVPESATLADAQEAMKKVPQCQDVFLTKTGAADEPIIGWITNADIAKQVAV